MFNKTRWHIALSEKDKELFQMCKREFIEHHPELKDFNITNTIVLRKVMKVYIDPTGKKGVNL
jgi:hypothetical protein